MGDTIESTSDLRMRSKRSAPLGMTHVHVRVVLAVHRNSSLSTGRATDVTGTHPRGDTRTRARMAAYLFLKRIEFTAAADTGTIMGMTSYIGLYTAAGDLSHPFNDQY